MKYYLIKLMYNKVNNKLIIKIVYKNIANLSDSIVTV